MEEAEDQCGEIKVTRISGLIDAKNISSALEFEFDRNVREVIILEDLVALSQHERWVSWPTDGHFWPPGVLELILNLALWSPRRGSASRKNHYRNINKTWLLGISRKKNKIAICKLREDLDPAYAKRRNWNIQKFAFDRSQCDVRWNQRRKN